jgi:hypothetical protein
MGDINTFIPDNLEQQWRWTVFHVKGSKKGNLGDSLEEAIQGYIEKYQDKIPTFPENNIES